MNTDQPKEPTKDKEDKLRFVPKFDPIVCTCGNCNDHTNFGYVVTMGAGAKSAYPLAVVTFCKN